jgi:protein-S-isoprenylcysteine O-methyltransferase Ste14
MRMTTMDYLSSQHTTVAGAISILCFLALGSVATVEEFLTENHEEEDTDDSEDESSSVRVLLNFWLLCFLGIVVILMRLVRDDNNLLYRALIGLLALMTLLDAIKRIAANQFSTYRSLGSSIALWWGIYELCRRHSRRAVSAWYCAAQMWAMCAFSSLAVLLMSIFLFLLEEPFDASDWISLNVLVICTVSNFVVALAPTSVAQEQQSDVSGDGIDFMQHL